MKPLQCWLLCLLLLVFSELKVEAGPPPTPIFNREKVEDLIENIEQKHSLTLLRAAYFGRRVEHPLPKTQGFSLVDAAAQKQTVGSRKWLLLHILRGYGAFRVRNQGDKGFDSYTRLFTYFEPLDSLEKQNMAATVVRNWVFTANSEDIIRSGFQGGDESKRLLGQAWKLYLRLPTPSSARPYDQKRAGAIKGLGVENDILKITQDVLMQPNTLKNEQALHLAFEVSAGQSTDDEAEQALTSLRQIEPFVKAQPQALGLLQYARAKLLQRQKHFGQSLEAARAATEISGRGFSLLVELLHRTGDKAALKDVVSRLKREGIDEGEIIETASTFSALKHRQQSKELLNFYLQSQRTRTSDREIEARLSLGEMLIAEKQKDEALVILRPAISLRPTSEVARQRLTLIQNLLK